MIKKYDKQIYGEIKNCQKLRRKLKSANSDNSRCMGLAEKSGITYYAISGFSEKDKDAFKEARAGVEDILKKVTNNLVFCSVDNAICSFVSKTKYIDNNKTLKQQTNKIYESLDLSYGLVKKRIKYSYPFDKTKTIKFNSLSDTLSSGFEKRKWSCVDRKIIGNACTNKIDIYCTERPCYFCIPEISRIYYFENYGYELYEMEVNAYNNICDITVNRLL